MARLARRVALFGAGCVENRTQRNLLLQVSYYTVWAVGVFVALDVLGVNAQAVVTGLGLGGVALGFALKDIISNFVSGLLILLTHTFEIGDQIVVGETEGTVEQIEVRVTHIRTYDGRLVLVPNGEVFTSRVTNNTVSPLRRASVFVYLDYRQTSHTGPLTKKRMETCDEEFLAAAKKFIQAAHDAGEPFFVWFNTSHMHAWTHVKPESRGQSGRWQSEYHDVMIDHDKHIGEMLDFLDELGIADNTFVQYSTDNGPHMNTWPDAGTTPFRNEKNSSWEGAYRVPCMVRFPGRIAAGSVSNEIISHQDWFPTILAVAGEPDIAAKLKKGHKIGKKTYKVHLDGYNLLPHLTGKEAKSPRQAFLYFTDDGDVAALRYDNWKMMFMEQRVPGTFQIWQEPFVTLRVPFIFNLRTDPYEKAQITSNTYYDWMFRRVYLLVPAQAFVGEFLSTFKEFPPRQKSASFSLDQVIEKMTAASSGG